MLHLQSLSKRYGPQTIFENLSWHVGRGVRIGLVGPNGAGKTTLLRILAKIETPDAGEVTSPKGTLIGYLPQEVETLAGSTVLGHALSGFAEVREIEEEIERLETQMASRSEPEALERLTRRYGDLRHRFEALGGYRLEGEAFAILGGLGFPSSSFHAPLTTLSGGWKMRAALAAHLLRRPDLLLLDEPTNHLDLESLAWLEEFLDEYEGSILIVSHDRFFLNSIVDGIAELEAGKLSLYPGSYDEYVEEKQARQEALLAAKRTQDRQIAVTERFIERFRYKATKARQVQSRVKRLAKIERIHIHRGPKTIRFAFPQPPRSGAETIRVEDVSKSFGDKVVYKNAHFTARRGDRIALIGPNGAGKSTLLKILAGVLPPDSGVRTLGHNVTLHYYAQHQLEALGAGRTVFEEIETVAPDDLRPKLRTLLGAFLFSGEDVDKKVTVLSGGEKARLALAKMLVRPASLLLLDEPTNHLDLRARGILEEALDQYTGTIVFISHDRYFINRIATSVCSVEEGRLDSRPGSYDDYMEWKQGQAEALKGRGPGASLRQADQASAASRTHPAQAQGTEIGHGKDAGAKAGGARGKRSPDASARGPDAKKTREVNAKPASARGRGGGDRARPGEGRHAAEEDRRNHPDKHGATLERHGPQGSTGAPKTRGQKRSEAEERNRRHLETKGFKERLAAVEKEIASLEVRLKELEGALADTALYRDADKARTTSREHREIQERIAWLYDEWADLEGTLSRLQAL